MPYKYALCVLKAIPSALERSPYMVGNIHAKFKILKA